ncbi:hypothetical protein SAMN05443572_101848 [Myxococcus fulvus]|uniref:Uncharacterized protein n=1 Tax=Myxococcus fulvus TaxID=33 RepID=A0A511SVN2_MYXFU|nr:hypothetical protein [Myxococcus fulvus]GEN05607.1 hypothetical protein MFU01_06440 [Myxococcus fulvus]SET01660.1 hypothetical protein SAMN05443572_101848 [Myxococcus fulvus]
MRRIGLLMGVLGCAGCATLTRGLDTQLNPETGEYETPTHETVYLAPPEDAMMMARRVLEEQRYDVMEKEGGLELFSSAHEPGKNRNGLRNHERYYVKGERLGPRQTLIRVFRLSYSEMENLIEETPKQIGDMTSRDSQLSLEETEHAFDARSEAHLSAPPARHNALRTIAMRNPFPNAPGLERFRYVRGYRDLDVEQTLLARMEMVPALELVGGNAPVSMRSVMMEGWGEAGDASAAAPDCGEPVEGAASLLSAGGVVLMADPLGTQELPSAALRMLCEATAQGLPVTLALSVPASEQPLLTRYLASEGTSQDAQELLRESAFWRRAHQDGRSSRAMLWLVEQARRLRASGKDVALAAIDADKAQGNEREAQLAANLLSFQSQRAQAWTLVLTGSVHARTTKVDWDGDLEPMGARVAKALPSVRALDVGFQRGTQFACRYSVWDDVECNVFGISPTLQARQSSKQRPGVALASEARADGFHGRLYLGTLNASPPALQSQSHVAHSAPARK